MALGDRTLKEFRDEQRSQENRLIRDYLKAYRENLVDDWETKYKGKCKFEQYLITKLYSYDIPSHSKAEEEKDIERMVELWKSQE